MQNKYYKKQLQFLQQSGRKFAQAHPSTAGLLGQTDSDPDVERLIEGFSYITGKIWERVDEDIPLLAQTIAEMCFPHCSYSIPSCSIVQFFPNSQTLTRPVTVRQGTELRANQVETEEKTSCRFSTTMPVELLPLEIQEVTVEKVEGYTLLNLMLNYWSKGEVFPNKKLRIFLHGEFAATTTIWLWLLRYCKQVEVSVVGAAKTRFTCNPESIVPVGLHPEGALLPWERLAFPGYRYFQEYLSFPKKFLFLDLQMSKPLVAEPGQQIQIYFLLGKPPELPGRISKDTFRLHCTPVINLFKTNAEPIHAKLLGQESLVRYAGLAAKHCEVYSVDRVDGVIQDGAIYNYPKFLSLDYCRSEGKKPFHFVRRQPSKTMEGFDTFLSIQIARGIIPEIREDVLSAAITCTNRDLARRLRMGDICHTPYRVAWQNVPFKNIMGVSPATPAPFGKEQFWDLLIYMAAARISVVDKENLCALLRMNDLQSINEDPRGLGNQKRIKSIISVKSEMSTVRQIIGTITTIHLEEAAFASKGEAYLFGCILDEFFGARASINSFHETRVILQPSRTEFLWRPRNGWTFL